MVAFVLIAVLGLLPVMTPPSAVKLPGPVPALFCGAPSNSIDRPVTVAGGSHVMRQLTHGVPPVAVPKF